jgi:3-oxoadipate enol-lactonase
MPFATARDGAQLYFEESGSGEPFLLIHGNAIDHRGWDPIRPDFADRYRVLVYDHRGTARA